MEQRTPELLDIIKARRHVYRHLQATPLHHYPTLSALLGCQIWVKHENHQPVGAFKVRGGLNLAAGLGERERAAGLYTASTGNHGQSIAFAGRAYGITVTVAVPDGANPGKVASMRALGAKVIEHGPDFDAAREWIMLVAKEQSGTFIGPTDEPLIAGVGTYGLEIMESLPEVDVIIVPVGAGSGASATAIVAKTIRPGCQVIGVQSAQAPAMQRSWQSGKMQEAAMRTVAEGLATRVPFANTQKIMRRLLDDFLLVEDRALEEAVRLLLHHTHNLAEEAGAAPLAAVMGDPDRFAGKKVVLVQSGGNLSLERLQVITGA